MIVELGLEVVPSFRTRRFNVLKLDENSRIWTWAGDIGEQALFIGNGNNQRHWLFVYRRVFRVFFPLFFQWIVKCESNIHIYIYMY